MSRDFRQNCNLDDCRQKRDLPSRSRQRCVLSAPGTGATTGIDWDGRKDGRNRGAVSTRGRRQYITKEDLDETFKRYTDLHVLDLVHEIVRVQKISYTSTRMSAKKGAMLLGRCLPFFPKQVMKQTARIQVKKMELDENLLMYFNKTVTFLAHDPSEICKSGDIVLVQELPKKLTPDIQHAVLKVVYPLGDITDPLTGKKVVASLYRDQVAATTAHYGANEEGFDYDKAPPRGWQEDKKDFTHRRSYIKYHEYEDDDQPYAV